MRILIATGIFPPEIGGPAKYVPEIAEALVAKGHQVTVIAPRNLSVPSPIHNPPYHLLHFPHAHYARYINLIIELKRAFFAILHEAQNCDIIFSNGLELPSIWVSQLTKKPLIMKIVGDRAWELFHTRRKTALTIEEFQFSKKWNHRLLRNIFHDGAKKANAIIVPSQYLSRIVENWGIEKKKIFVIYNSINENAEYLKQCNNLDTSLGFSSGIRLVSIGRLLPHKNIDEIIKILPSIPAANLVLIGDGPLKNLLQQLAVELGLSDRVMLVGSQDQIFIHKLLSKNCDIFILNSSYEGLPHVLLEASYNNIPIIATRVGGTIEFIQDKVTGLLITPHNSEELIKAINTLTENTRLRQEIILNAKKRLKCFSFKRMVIETEKLLYSNLPSIQR